MTAIKSLSNGAALMDMYPQLISLSEVRPIMEAIADDNWLTTVGPWLRVADLVKDEDALWRKLSEQVPELTKYDLLTPAESLSDAASYLRRTRRATIRTIAVACGLGTQTFVNHALFAGDASLTISVIPGLSCRIGRAASVAWKSSPHPLQRTQKVLENFDAVKAVETAIFPISACDDYEKRFADWLALAPLREWDESHRLPLIGVRTAVKATPAGYIERYKAEDARPVGVPFVVVAKIVSPYAARIVREVRSKLSPVLPNDKDLVMWAVNRCGD